MLDLQTTPLVSINHQRVTTTSLLISSACNLIQTEIMS
jgi:hypothetical protein